MYNPYGWKITKSYEKKKTPEMKMDVYPGTMKPVCVMDELGTVSAELALKEIKLELLREKVEDAEDDVYLLKKRKKYLLQRLNES